MGKKAKKVKAPEFGRTESATTSETWMQLTMEIETLERHLLVKTRMEEKYRSSCMLMRDKVEQMQSDFLQEQQTTFAVTADMARQYKALQEDLIHKINALETTLTEQKEELDMTQHELKELIKDKDDVLAHKSHIIAELKNRMEAMCQEFHEMLGSTLKLMKENMAAKLTNDPSLGDGLNGDDSQEAKMRQVQEGYAQKLQEYSAGAYKAASSKAG